VKGFSLELSETYAEDKKVADAVLPAISPLELRVVYLKKPIV